MRLLRDHPEIAFGVHLTVVSEFADYRWGPLAPRDRVPSLLDETGSFYSNDRQAELLARARLDELEVEFRAQIEAVLSAGLRPTHLDWHCLRDGGRPDVFDLTLGLASEYGLALRVFDPTRSEPAAAAGSAHRRPRGGGQHAAGDGGQDGPVRPDAARAAGRAERVGGPPRPRHRRGAGHRRLVGEARGGLHVPGLAGGAGDGPAEGIVLLDYRALQAVWGRISRAIRRSRRAHEHAATL